jgi:formylglycine-generating enzyme required for sulfatase activity
MTCIAVLTTLAALAVAPPAPDAAKPASLAAFREPLKGTTLDFGMVPVVPKDGSKPFYIAATETTWDCYDAFVFGFDQDATAASQTDAATRPSKPYISMDRGYGHAGFPAISVSYLGAKKYCEWLSAKTGKKYRLPTVHEWQVACELAAVPKDMVKDFAWCAENAKGKTHAVGTAKADALGAFDLYGNASEWCSSESKAADGTTSVVGVTLGGTFKDAAEKLGCASVVASSPDWNASDPQYPKSKWWLADGGFVGFRVVCEP